jgi:hypothetical protein
MHIKEATKNMTNIKIKKESSYYTFKSKKQFINIIKIIYIKELLFSI